MYLIKVSQFCLALVGVASWCNAEKKPNIVMIVADDVGWNDVGFHGSNQIDTPNIDALGLNGIYFDRYYAQQSCTPSRSALLTGRYPIRLGYQGKPLHAGENRSISHDFWTLPKALKGLGYMNHLVGKWHLGSASKNFTPQAYGYDSHYGYLDGFVSYFDHDIQSDGHLGKDMYSDHQPLTNTTGEYFTDLVTRKSIEVIKNHPQEKPLHLVISHLAAHTGKSTSMGGFLEVASDEYNDKKYGYIPDKIRRMYAEIVERMDTSIGDVVEALDRKGILDNTIIVFFSDNGAPTNGFFKNRGSNFPFRGIKLSLFEGGVRVPAVVYSSKFKNKGRIYKN
ncbi:PREDICTED: arylsulfatase B-like, partial [Nicrophorus vespilloides]|uniref:Arylsulfatase B-like n=1 Tax=Nicrophorus vespilloides TaxID=110193 RepID=A0ABM1MJC7_NICVS